MIKRSMLVMATGLVVAAPAAAQDVPGASLVRDAMVQYANGKFLPGFCSITKGVDNKTKQAQDQLKIAVEDKDATKRARALESAWKLSEESVRGAPKIAGHWYYNGRIAFMRGDVVAGDTAFTRTVELSPDCDTDVSAMRQNAWAPLTNAAIDALNAQKSEEAIGLFRTANIAFRKRPEAMTRIAVAFANAEQVDSAIVWFSKAIEVSGTDSTLAAEKAQARLNLGAMYQRKQRHTDAIPVFEAQFKETPTDVRLMRSLALSYRAAGRIDDAAKLEEQSRDVGSKGGEDGIGASDLFNDAVTMFNEKKFAESAVMFGKVLELEPYNRDALSNQANAYLGGGDSKGLVAAARKLIERDPFGEVNHKLLIQGLRDLSDQDAMMKAAEVFLPLPINLEARAVNNGESGMSVTVTITGREAKDLTGKVLAPAPMSIRFSFVDNTGATASTADIDVPALKAGETKEFKIDSQGKPVVGFTYARK